MPIGYHGRASTVVVSGTDITRPSGQQKMTDGSIVFEKTRKLDYELEMAFVVGKGNAMGCTVAMEDAMDHVFGMVLMNDWSGTGLRHNLGSTRHSVVGICSAGPIPRQELWHVHFALGRHDGRLEAIHGAEPEAGKAAL